MTFLTDMMVNLLELDHMTRLADLFAVYMNDYQLAVMITNSSRENIMERNTFCTKVGHLLFQQGKLEHALVLHQKALDVQVEIHGPDHYAIADSYYNMALVLHHQGKLEEAVTLHQNELEIYLKENGLGNGHTGNSYNTIVNVLKEHAIQQNRRQREHMR